ncbi:MAG: SDR family oxidoreductase, partial [Caldilineaceae bacterium]
VHETPLDEWEQMLRLNLFTALTMSRAVTPTLIEQGRGRMIHVGSKSGVVGGANVAAYAAAKSALATLAESQAAELKGKGITVNVVLPSTIDTAENRAASPKADAAKWVQPKALAEVILFLASPPAQEITGATIPVYGRV